MVSRPVRLGHRENGGGRYGRKKYTMSSLIIHCMIAMLAGGSYGKSIGE